MAGNLEISGNLRKAGKLEMAGHDAGVLAAAAGGVAERAAEAIGAEMYESCPTFE